MDSPPKKWTRVHSFGQVRLCCPPPASAAYVFLGLFLLAQAAAARRNRVRYPPSAFTKTARQDRAQQEHASPGSFGSWFQNLALLDRTESPVLQKHMSSTQKNGLTQKAAPRRAPRRARGLVGGRRDVLRRRRALGPRDGAEGEAGACARGRRSAARGAPPPTHAAPLAPRPLLPPGCATRERSRVRHAPRGAAGAAGARRGGTSGAGPRLCESSHSAPVRGRRAWCAEHCSCRLGGHWGIGGRVAMGGEKERGKGRTKPKVSRVGCLSLGLVSAVCGRARARRGAVGVTSRVRWRPNRVQRPSRHAAWRARGATDGPLATSLNAPSPRRSDP